MEDPKQFGHKLLSQEFDLHNDWPNMVPSAMRNGIRNELMRIHAEQKAERDANRKAKKVVKRTGKVMLAAQAEANSSLEKDVAGSTATRGGILKPPSLQVAIDQPATSTGRHNSPGQQLIEDKNSHSPQTGQTPASSPITSKPEEVDASNVDDAMLFDEHPPRTPTSRNQRFQSAPPLSQDTSEMEVNRHGQLDGSAETAAAGQRLPALPAGDSVPLLARLMMRGKTESP